jgi:hypothetical protein
MVVCSACSESRQRSVDFLLRMGRGISPSSQPLGETIASCVRPFFHDSRREGDEEIKRYSPPTNWSKARFSQPLAPPNDYLKDCVFCLLLVEQPKERRSRVWRCGDGRISLWPVVSIAVLISLSSFFFNTNKSHRYRTTQDLSALSRPTMSLLRALAPAAGISNEMASQGAYIPTGAR